MKPITKIVGSREAMTDSSVLSPTRPSGLGGTLSDLPIGHHTASH